MIFRLTLLLTLALLSAGRAEEARYFRVAGPVVSTITAFNADGYMTWTNEPTNATFTVQTAVSLVGPSNWVDYIQVPATNPVTTHRLYDPNPPSGMVLIPAGTFTMGDTLDGLANAIPISVTVSAFYMDVNLVSYSQWQAVYNWATNHGYAFAFAGDGKAADHPVQTVNWYDMVKWSNARSELEGRLPAYYTDAAQTAVYRSGQIDVQNDWVKWNAGYRLPTEAEWEKAARGGTSGHRFPWGDTVSWSQANYYALPLSPNYAYDVNPTNGENPAFTTGGQPYTSPVGYFSPNGYGLYDMAGNVLQWCWDKSGPYAGGSDPRGSTNPGTDHILRGGGYPDHANILRCAARLVSLASSYGYEFGFRCVRGL